MHTEEWFRIGWQEYSVFALLVAIYLVLVFANRLPTMTVFKEFADTINTAGGHILILGLFSLYFFRTAMRFFFYVLSLPIETLTKHDAIIMTGVGFLTGTAFGGAWGALLKTMSGGKANGAAPAPTQAAPIPAAPTPAIAPALTTPAPSGAAMGFAPNRAGIGDVGHRGHHGDLGTNNRS